MKAALAQDGFAVFKSDARVGRWAAAAYRVAAGIARDPAWRGPENLRHQRTWFVGIDALPNETSGAIAGVPLVGPWQTSVPKLALHRAQVSSSIPDIHGRIRRRVMPITGFGAIGRRPM